MKNKKQKPQADQITVTHSPLPWRHWSDITGYSLLKDGQGSTVITFPLEKIDGAKHDRHYYNAALVEKSVNWHPELVELIRAAADYIATIQEDFTLKDSGILRDLEKTIAIMGSK